MDEMVSERFDFDEWADLHRRDPAAFEARRQALLMLELARGEPGQRDAARAALARYEHAAHGLDGPARARLSAEFMRDSLSVLRRELDELGRGVDRALGAPPRRRRRGPRRLSRPRTTIGSRMTIAPAWRSNPRNG